MVDGIDVFGMGNLTDVIGFLNRDFTPEPVKVNLEEEFFKNLDKTTLDFADVKGQENVKRRT